MKGRVRNSHILRRSVLRHVAPVTVWLAAVVAVVWLFYQRSQQFQIVGIVQGEVREVAADCTARITNISVSLFDPVQAGQVLAVLDTVAAAESTVEAELRTQVATAAAEVERLMALLIPTHDQLLSDAAGREINHADNQRRFAVDVESARLRMLQLETSIASEQITLRQLQMDVKIAEELLKDKAIVPYELEKAKIQLESTVKRLDEYQQEFEQARADLAEAERRQGQFSRQQLPAQSVDKALEAIRKEAKVQEELIKGLLDQIAALKARQAVELTSPVDGVVIPIRGRANEVLLQRPGEATIRRPGEVVAAGDPILAVARMTPAEIIAYASEQQSGFLERDMTVELVKINHPAQMAQSRIVSIGPTIELMPQRLWRSPTIPQWGRPVLIEVPPGLAVIPGEIVGIRGQ